GVLYCANHPNVETLLRCNRCGKPICTRCAVSTPVGYRCRECVGQQQSSFYPGGTLDYVMGKGTAFDCDTANGDFDAAVWNANSPFATVFDYDQSYEPTPAGDQDLYDETDPF
ncbi:MAG: B-box zinc finger protein, partial [Anaerolineae bacterium]